MLGPITPAPALAPALVGESALDPTLATLLIVAVILAPTIMSILLIDARRKAARALKRQRRIERVLDQTRVELDRLRRGTSRAEAMERVAAMARAGATGQTSGREAPGLLSPDFRSEFGEDSLIWQLLDRQTTGFFVEVGAYDGVTLSVSAAFEAIGWTGLLIEAIPERFEQCKSSRPKSRVVHAALGKRGSSGTTRFHVARGEGLEVLSYHHTPPEQEREVRKRGAAMQEVEVPLMSMDALLEGHTGPIDFASIDVEGAELELLDGFDLKKWKPRLIVIEDISAGKSPALNAKLDACGYVLVAWLGFNQVRVHRGEEAILARAAVLPKGAPMFAEDAGGA
ncbi:MAG: FkbM family methyltransferase [Phycisphaerae bacterium]|nr:FkbM family methyltransferase [Phycisphaerae bacterium]